MTLTAFLPTVGIVALVIVILLVIVAVFRSMWQIVGPNEALIVSGAGSTAKDGERTYKIVVGAGALVLPGFQKASRLSLKLYEVPLEVDCVSKQGIRVILKGVCMFKVANDPRSITNAASRFLGQEDKMQPNMLNLLDGHLRSIAGNMTVEDLIGNRTVLSDQTRASAKVEVETLGLIIDSLQLQDLGDPTKYIDNLAKPHLAAVQQAARIAQAAADRDASIAEQAAAAVTADAKSQSEIKQAASAANTAKARAEAEQQGPLAAAKAQQAVIEEQTRMAALQAEQTAAQLAITVKAPADAERYRVQVAAEAARDAAIAAATADAQRTKLQGEAEAGAVRARLEAEAAGIKLRGEAMATNQDAVIAQQLAQALPQIMASIAAPFGNIKELVVTNGGDGLMQMLTGITAQAGTVLPILRRALAQNSASPPSSSATNGTPTGPAK